MKEIAYFILPLGGIFACLLCLPVQFIQRACISLSCLQLSLGSRFSLRISSTFFFYSLCRFVHTWIRVNQNYFHSGIGAHMESAGKWTAIHGASGGGFPGMHSPPGSGGSLDVRRQAQVLRYQRNFWITLSAVFIWLFVWWLAKLLRWYWQAIEQREAIVKELKKKRENTSVGLPRGATPQPKPGKDSPRKEAVAKSEKAEGRQEGIEMTCTSQKRDTYDGKLTTPEKSRQRVVGRKDDALGSAVVD